MKTAKSMKSLLVFLVVVAISQASVLESRIDVQALRLVTLISLNPLGLEVVWTPVPSWSFNPIVGYKVNIWQQQTQTVYEYELIDGVYQWVGKEVLAPATMGQCLTWKFNLGPSYIEKTKAFK